MSCTEGFRWGGCIRLSTISKDCTAGRHAKETELLEDFGKKLRAHKGPSQRTLGLLAEINEPYPDKWRHAFDIVFPAVPNLPLKHFEDGIMVCSFCPGYGSAGETSFNCADVFKRHLKAVHGLEQIPSNSSTGPSSGKKLAGYSLDAFSKCVTCLQTFSNAQDLYEHCATHRSAGGPGRGQTLGQALQQPATQQTSLQDTPAEAPLPAHNHSSDRLSTHSVRKKSRQASRVGKNTGLISRTKSRIIKSPTKPSYFQSRRESSKGTESGLPWVRGAPATYQAAFPQRYPEKNDLFSAVLPASDQGQAHRDHLEMRPHHLELQYSRLSSPPVKSGRLSLRSRGKAALSGDALLVALLGNGRQPEVAHAAALEPI